MCLGNDNNGSDQMNEGKDQWKIMSNTWLIIFFGEYSGSEYYVLGQWVYMYTNWEQVKLKENANTWHKRQDLRNLIQGTELPDKIGNKDLRTQCAHVLVVGTQRTKKTH